jgi:hypothetical protein
MPINIACPGCNRALTLPDEHMNRSVQCPACKQAFHPAEAAPAGGIRPAAAGLGVNSANKPGEKEPKAPPIPPSRPPLPATRDDTRGSTRRRKRKEEDDLCPKCRGLVPRSADRCPECGAELEPEAETDYRPWEQSGLERRDSAAHRGTFILLLGLVSFALALLFWCPMLFRAWLGVVASSAGLATGLSAWMMGHKDLRKMEEHSMDRRGRGSTNVGMIFGIIGTLIGGIAWLIALGVALYSWLN